MEEPGLQVYLSTGVNDEWVPVEPGEHDGVLRAQVVSGQTVGLPLDPLVRVRQELGTGHVGAVGDGRHVQVMLPCREQVLAGLLVKVACKQQDERKYVS